MKELGSLLIILIGTTAGVLGQAKPCEIVYQTADNNPAYDGGMTALVDYSGKQLAQIISECQSRDSDLTTRLTVVLTIGADGKVTDAELSNHRLTKDCEEQLRKKLLTMTGWTPGRVNGQKVCCKYIWVISCIKWG